MSSATSVTGILNATLDAVDAVMPGTFTHGTLSMITPPLIQQQLGVIVGITGDVRGRLYVSTTLDSFARMGTLMYGIHIGEDMLQSFAAEFGNMVGGHMVRLAEGMKLDISPPTAVEGNAQITGFSKAILVPMDSDSVGQLHVALMLEAM